MYQRPCIIAWSLSRKLISCSIGRAYVPASRGRLIGCYIPFLPSLTLSCSNSSDGISWASSIPDWHWLIDMSLYWSLWKKPPAKTIIKKIYTALTKLNCILQPFHVWKVMGISHMYDNSLWGIQNTACQTHQFINVFHF